MFECSNFQVKNDENFRQLMSHREQNVTCFGGGKSTLVYIAIFYLDV